ncbi:MAG: hypothetical protein LKI42_04770 [Bacteroidales bacterium]|nr:hypothetical protein [Bacteroidales bacterium]MCI1785749.1 hypothetical protein [Bacteroidales bacterium]
MSDVFNIKRFAGYYKYDFKNIVSRYGFSFMILSCAGLFFYMFYILFHFLFSNYEWQAPSFNTRLLFFFAMSCAMAITFPAKSYGFLTNKKEGSEFTLIPVSVTEKFIAMMFNSLVVLPILFVLIYFGCDGLICAMDPTAHSSLALNFNSFFRDSGNADFVNVSIVRAYFSLVNGIMVFLLGALIFKKRKISGVILILMSISVLVIILIASYFNGTNGTDWNINFLHFAKTYNIIEIIWTWIVFFGISTAIFFRIKTIKH